MGKAYYKLIASFLLLLFVCVLGFGIYSYNSVTKDAKERAIANNETLLNIYKGTVDKSLSDIDKNFIQNSMIIELLDGLSLPASGSTDYLSQKKNLNLHDFVVHIGSGNQILDSVLIYYKDEKMFLTSRGRFAEAGFWGEQIVQDIKNTNKNIAWVGPLSIQSSVHEKKIWMISYIRQLPLITSYKKAAFIGNVNLTKLSELVETFEDKYEGQKIYAINNEGTVIVDRDQKLIGKNIGVLPYIQIAFQDKQGSIFYKDENNHNILLSYTGSDVASWKYIIVTPVDSLLASSNSIIKGTIYMSVLIGLIGIILSILLSKKLYQPVQSLVTLFHRDGSPQKKIHDEYAFINDLFNDLEKDNKYLHNQIQNNLEMVKEKVFLDILKDGIDKYKEIDRIFRDYGITITFKNYIVIALEMDHVNQMELFGQNLGLFSIKNIVDEMINEEYIGFVTSEDNTVFVLIDFPQADYYFDYKQTARYLCSQVIENIYNFIGFSVSVGVSRCYTEVDRLKIAYIEAKEAINYTGIYGQRSLVFIEDVQPRGAGLRGYPYDLSRDLIKYIKIIDRINVEKVLLKIINFFRENQLSYRYTYQFCMQLIGLLIIGINDMGYEDYDVFSDRSIFEELEGQKILEDMHTWLSDICTLIMDFFDSDRKKQSKDIVGSAKEYIDKHYMNSGLSLSSVAEYIYISDSHLSRIFGEEMGINFNDYVTQKRIEKSKKLLLDTDMNIKEISNEIGLSIQSFMRNFKKQENITPGQYRTKFKN